MTKIIIFTLVITTQLLANYTFDTNNKKIDMHGGKSEKLTDGNNRFSEIKMNSFTGLKDISIKKPKEFKDLKEKQNLELEDIKMNK